MSEQQSDVLTREYDMSKVSPQSDTSHSFEDYQTFIAKHLNKYVLNLQNNNILCCQLIKTYMN
jgi:hypothetical protein